MDSGININTNLTEQNMNEQLLNEFDISELIGNDIKRQQILKEFLTKTLNQKNTINQNNIGDYLSKLFPLSLLKTSIKSNSELAKKYPEATQLIEKSENKDFQKNNQLNILFALYLKNKKLLNNDIKIVINNGYDEKSKKKLQDFGDPTPITELHEKIYKLNNLDDIKSKEEFRKLNVNTEIKYAFFSYLISGIKFITNIENFKIYLEKFSVDDILEIINVRDTKGN